jgi:hypothetical protein
LGDDFDSHDTILERLSYIKNQLSWLRSCVERNTNSYIVTVVSTCPLFIREKLLDLIKLYGFQPYLILNSLNTFEYHGFYCLMDIARNNYSDNYIFYCHSKGVVNRLPNSENIFKMHTHFLLQDNVFQNLPINAKKIGLFPSQYGWMWHNFFWISVDDLLSKNLLVSNNRHYYESFIGNPSNELAYKDCFAFRPPDFDKIGFMSKKYYISSDLGESVPSYYKHISKFNFANEILEY